MNPARSWSVRGPKRTPRRSPMPDPTPDPRAEVLRAAGHADAAELLERLNAIDADRQPKAPETQTPAQRAASPITEEALALRDAMNRGISERHRAGEL